MKAILLLLAVCGTPQDGANSTYAVEERPYHEIQAEISDLLKREAQAKNNATRAATVAEMCRLHREIVSDPRYLTSDVLKEYRTRLWSRLTRVKTEIKHQLARAGRQHRETLDDLATLEATDAASAVAADSLASSLSLAGDLQGGPGQLFHLGGAAGPPDWGPGLVDLIERTINPSFWDVNGGPGSIIYYRPLLCIVVRATAEVHGNISGAIGGLRAAGR
jgi:hypothetical protein